MPRPLSLRALALKALPLLLTLTLTLPPQIPAQRIGSPESHPKLITHHCTLSTGCKPLNTSVVLDAATHNIHAFGDENIPCVTNGTLDDTLCPDKESCAENCVVEGFSAEDYIAHGVHTEGETLTLTQYRDVGNGSLVSVSPRVYLLSSSSSESEEQEQEQEYEILSLLGQEFTFTVDVSLLPCGMNGALYLSSMSPTGGANKYNPAGATYGTGYCDAQCYVTPWINGAGNVKGNGACCHEMDIWEGNSRATGFTPHACLYEPGDVSGDGTGQGVYECTTDEECNGPTGENDSICDKWGCGFNPYALGDQEFYGRDDIEIEGGFAVDTTQPFTVVTQFLTSDNSTTGDLVSIRRLYIQQGRLIHNALIPIGSSNTSTTLLSDRLCAATSSWFDSFGGMAGMGEPLGRGMVLAMSIWNDAGEYMQWLDGGDSGPCNATEGSPENIEATIPGTKVVFGNLRWGDLGSTFRDKF
ncbi:concanavalin A-like lectin/glucanase domain-containing protein [Aspergillus stella-maris]|uniref:concanavalin A-like lectin/glucanase domain-containing protein n=1 Tax=Aspergillus stella-maris TaxID=1810926 RepID=UPI003CCDD702